MRVYQITGTAIELFHVGTLADARAEVKREEPAYRGAIEVQEVDVEMDKANLLRLLNNAGGTHTYTGRTWKGTRGGGLKETTVPQDRPTDSEGGEA